MLSAVAFALSASDGRTVEDAVRGAVAEREAVTMDSVEVSGIGDLPNAPELADWAVELPRIGPVTGDVRVVVRSGALRYSVLPHVVVWRTLPVAAGPVAAGAAVPVTTARVSSDRLRAAPVDATGDWTARVPLERGQPLTAVNVRASPDVRRGGTVEIVASAGRVSVTAPGRLLDDAFVGERVGVLNLATRTVQSGTYRGDSVVVLEQR